jgi:hypothetical protein
MSKKIWITVIAFLVLVATSSVVSADKPTGFDSKGNEIAWEKGLSSCTKIQDGTLYTSDGELVVLGFNPWGYNYQGHVFNGMYCDYHPVYRPGGAGHEWCMENYGDVQLIMKWNDAWLANTDCDGDGSLDRHYDFPSYIGSGAWTTNHMSGSYDLDGKQCTWTYFVKIVAAPLDATVDDGIWYAADGTEIGAVIWGSFAIIQEVENDPCAGIHGVQYLSPDHVGLGGW